MKVRNMGNSGQKCSIGLHTAGGPRSGKGISVTCLTTNMAYIQGTPYGLSENWRGSQDAGSLLEGWIPVGKLLTLNHLDVKGEMIQVL